MGLFKPDYLSNDIQKAIEAVSKLNNQNKLAAVATKHPSKEVRLEAVKKLTYPPALEEIMLNDIDPKVRFAAIKPQTYLASKIYSLEEREFNESIILNESVLFKVAMHDKHSSVALCAIDKIQSPHILFKIALTADDTDKVKQALCCLADNQDFDKDNIYEIYEKIQDSEVKKEIISNYSKQTGSLLRFSSITDDIELFKYILSKAKTENEVIEIANSKGFKLPICSICKWPVFSYYKLKNDQVCCDNCLNYSDSKKDVSIKKGIICGEDFPKGSYWVNATITSDEGDEIKIIRNGEVFASFVLNSKYNEEGIKGKMKFEFLDGDILKGDLRVGLQQLDIGLELTQITDLID